MKRLSCLLVLALVAPAVARWSVDIEAGPVFSGYNNVQIPGDTGTLFSLTEDLHARTAFAYRARLSKTFGDRHWVSVLSRRCGLSPAEHWTATCSLLASVSLPGKN
jgi:hypothetical protein